MVMTFTPGILYAQQLKGIVLGTANKGLSGASVKLLQAGKSTITTADGNFEIAAPKHSDTLLVTHIGYQSRKIPANNKTLKPISIQLNQLDANLEEVVVNTGYYQVPQERATGAFTQINNKQLNRSVSRNILDRLEGVTHSLLFDRRNLKDENINGNPELRVRGLSTIEADSRPLIVLDNFPYEGDVSTINPNDVESITVLRDAAAASIWGARAGNGVIVINTKQGRYNQPTQISFNSNFTLGQKPDLLYSQQYLPAKTIMELQKELFKRGIYAENDQTIIPLYVELLIKQRDNKITAADFTAAENRMQTNDLRKDWQKYLYQSTINQQYALMVNGGGGNHRYALSAGYDQNRGTFVGNKDSRLNLSMSNSFKAAANLELSLGLWFTKQQAANNGLGYSSTADLSLYESLKDENGNANAINSPRFRYAYQEQGPKNGLLDGMLRPLDEVRMADNRTKSHEWRLNAGMKYRFLKYFDMNTTYQYTMSDNQSESYHPAESYFVRSLVNQYTQTDGSRKIPNGAIMEYFSPAASYSHSGRAQLNYNQHFRVHQLAALAGAEVREAIGTTKPGQTLYNFDKELWISNFSQDFSTSYPLRPSGSARIPSGIFSPTKSTGRNLSYFGNTAYTYQERYILSGSIRWDGSNLLGVKSNQRGTALWSLGASWELSKEPFYNFSSWLPYLRLRSTYGGAGNIDKTQSHYPTIAVGTNNITSLPFASLKHPGNPALRWEQVRTLNFGLDFQATGQRISGSIEYYQKQAKDLLSTTMMDLTTGISPGSNYKMNYAGLYTSGWDIQISSRNLISTGLSWSSSLLLSHSSNKITSYNGPAVDAGQHLSGKVLRQGQSVDLIYSLPWYGLDPTNGMPIIYVDGKPTTTESAYANYYFNYPVEKLIVAGAMVPVWFGSVNNIFTWKKLELSALIAFKVGHVFRRRSIGPGQEYLTSPVYHMDYFKRWQKPGDELHTDVPARTENAAPNQRFGVYQQSMALITKGDVIRLQDISLGYTLNDKQLRGWPLQSIKLYAYARNLGILWRANKNGIDPDYANADYPAPRTFAFGLQAGF